MNTPNAGAKGLFEALDHAIFRIEQAMVTVAGLVMTSIVTLDIIYRTFASTESQFARKLLTPLGWFGVEKTEANYGFLRDYVTPTVLIGLAFIAGWAMYGSARRREKQPSNRVGQAMAGVGAVGAAYGIVQFILNVSSQWVCATLLLVGVALYLFDTWCKRDWAGVAVGIIVGVAGSWACTLLPQEYIWGQELSLILLAWMAFIGASMATRKAKHIQVDALSKLIPVTLRPWTRALGLLTTTVFCAYICALSYEHLFGPKGDYFSGAVRPATQLPAWTIILSVLVAFSLMTLRFLALALDAFIHPSLPSQEISH